MFCTECGKNIPDGSLFCTFCGAEVEGPKQMNVPGGNQPVSRPVNQMGSQPAYRPMNQNGNQSANRPMNQMGSQPAYRPMNQNGKQSASRPVNQMGNQTTVKSANQTGGKKGISSKLAIVIVACSSVIVICIGVLLIVMLGGKKQSINLDEYIEVEYSLEDGKTKATAYFDVEAFMKDYKKTLKYNKKPKNADDYKNAAEYMAYELIGGGLDKTTDIKNGDKLKYEWEIDEDEIEKYIKADVEYSTLKFEVEGLDESLPEEEAEGVEETDESEGDQDKEENAEESSEAKAEEEVKEEAYNIDTLPVEVVDVMKSSTEAMIDSDIQNYYVSGFTVTNKQYMGLYFQTPKDASPIKQDSIVTLVYAVDLNANIDMVDALYTGTVGYYTGVTFYGVGKDENGNPIYNVDEYSKAGETEILNTYVEIGGQDKKFAFHGYSNVSTLYDEMIASREGSHVIESNINYNIVPVATNGSSTSTHDEAVSSGDGMIIPDSSTRLLTEAEVKALNKQEVQTAINEIYARHGYKFKDENILAYFQQFDWYEPLYTSQEDVSPYFNDVEVSNLALLDDYR
ncbi:MAG: YARHG domain-containing protein [Eubacterium sp.]|nr:YARHG domain-containing protein [Eubacterium sp.]